jgi:putative pyruvate formate lyase activating enzyme
MGCSRREFLKGSIAAGALALVSPGCSRAKGIADENFEPAYLKLQRQGKLKKRAEKLWEVLKECTLCPRKTRKNRLAGETDVCGLKDEVKVHSAGPHFGEERPLVGSYGSGTIFFSNCNLLCVFCQNWEIAHRGDGSPVSHKTLARTMLRLQKMGCHNINLVTPTHVVPHIVRALQIAVGGGLKLPLVYNTGGYDSLETIKMLDGIVDIYMPDFKFQDAEVAYKYTKEAEEYPQAAAAAIKEMHRQVGELKLGKGGVALRGVILRHLVMPENLAGTDRFVKWVAKELSPNTYVNIMGQYRPEHMAHKYPKIARRITRDELHQAIRWAKDAGLTRLD